MTEHLQYWPPALPSPEVSYTQETAAGRIESDFEIAPTERITNQNFRHKASLSWRFSEREYHAFRAWYFHRLHDGADWFDADWLNPCRCQLVGDYKTTINQGFYTVSASAELDYAVS
ncbi:hypothetical protein [Endozoicomonas sp. GU-1]|uniref:hypothetical protein n=1 Tax=Endozoicomonas sp. GU-1 TaxID=3009078 RepID=UPI0022B5B144|nr:hypothetical protein [Endozoicomonas sp. GU-1]WBA79547.1 hypothetical protein O2T12_14280 [Endozoicomonas sp. GU-1]